MQHVEGMVSEFRKLAGGETSDRSYTCGFLKSRLGSNEEKEGGLVLVEDHQLITAFEQRGDNLRGCQHFLKAWTRF